MAKKPKSKRPKKVKRLKLKRPKKVGRVKPKRTKRTKKPRPEASRVEFESAPSPLVPELPKPKPVPARHRVLRCERCRTYLFDIFLVSCDPGTKTCFIVTMKCRNKGCRHTNQVTVDLVNEDARRQTHAAAGCLTY